MPLHEYVCQECGARFERLLHASTDPQMIRCPRCGRTHLLDLCHQWHAERRDCPRLRAGGLRYHPPAALSRAPSRLIDRRPPGYAVACAG